MNQPPWEGLFPTLRRIRFNLKLRNIEPLRIGVGRGGDRLGAPVDLSVYRQQVVRKDGGGYKISLEPVIPGSSLKGVLRTASMALAASCGLEAHSGVGGDDCVNKIFGNTKTFDEYRGERTPDDVRSALRGFCPLCLLYGAPNFSSRVHVGDFVPTTGARVGVKTGVGINRRTGAAQVGMLYTVEYVEPGAVFEGSISAVNTPNWMLALLAGSLLAIGQGWLKIGGFKSRGMGRVEIVGVEFKVEPVKVEANSCLLPPLDLEVDEPLSLNGCRVEGSSAICSDAAAYRLLEELATAWSSKYCSKLRELFEKRRKTAQQLIEAYQASSEGEGF